MSSPMTTVNVGERAFGRLFGGVIVAFFCGVFAYFAANLPTAITVGLATLIVLSILAVIEALTANGHGVISSIAGKIYWFAVFAIPVALLVWSLGFLNDVDPPWSDSDDDLSQVIATPQAAEEAATPTVGPTSTSEPSPSPEATRQTATLAATSVAIEPQSTATEQLVVETQEVEETEEVLSEPTSVAATVQQEPSPTPTPELEVDTTWTVSREGSPRSEDQDMVAVLVFNEHDSALVLSSNQQDEIIIQLEQAPDMGENQIGMASFLQEGFNRTVISFRYDSELRQFIPVTAHGEDLPGDIKLSANPDDPVYISQSLVVGDCSSVECAVEVVRTSGFASPGSGMRCEEYAFEDKTGTNRMVRSANGYSVVYMGGSFGPSPTPLPTWQCAITGQDQPLYILKENGSLIWPRGGYTADE